MPERPNAEQERLMKLREKQLSARDPYIKQRKRQQDLAEKERRVDRSMSLGKMWKGLSNLWKGFYIAFILGMLTFFAIITLWDSPSAMIVGGVIVLFFIIIGVVTGNAFDVRDEVERLTK